MASLTIRELNKSFGSVAVLQGIDLEVKTGEFVVLALWIKLVSPGPVFFRQERIGYRGKRFMILKFRTMKVNVETRSHENHLEQLINANVPMTKLDSAGDPRIIPGGRILRATGLDELPQLFNVLRGEMSLVGPRPCTPHEFKNYQVWQKERVNVPPGLTGYWQVNGKNKTTFSEMIKLDIFYTKNLSLWLDLTIMLRTAPALLAQVIESRFAQTVGLRHFETVKPGENGFVPGGTADRGLARFEMSKLKGRENREAQALAQQTVGLQASTNHHSKQSVAEKR